MQALLSRFISLTGGLSLDVLDRLAAELRLRVGTQVDGNTRGSGPVRPDLDRFVDDVHRAGITRLSEHQPLEAWLAEHRARAGR